VKFNSDESKAQKLNAESHLFLLTPSITLYISRLAKGSALHFFNYKNDSFMKIVTNLSMFQRSINVTIVFKTACLCTIFHVR